VLFHRLTILILAFALAGCAVEGDADSVVRYQQGDNQQWAAPDWDDSGWDEAALLSIQDATGIMWIRQSIRTKKLKTLGLSVAGVVAREVYWDGVLIGSAGRVGVDKEAEVVGPVDRVFRIPDSLSAPGQHVVAVRISNFHKPSSITGLRMAIEHGEYRDLVGGSFNTGIIPLFFLGGFILIALYYAVLFINDYRRLPYLLTSLLCLSVAGLLTAESWRPLIGYTYNYHALRISLIDVLTGIVGLLLSATFAYQFRIAKKWIVIGALAVILSLALLLIEDHETGTYVAFVFSLLSALSISGWASLRGASGSYLALTGVVICLVTLIVSGYDFMEEAFFPAFGLLIVGLLTSVSLQIREERKQHAVAVATAVRLENQLLKKHLQPHFLMNTLTSIIEWVETDPEQGAKAIEALASELRKLSDVSGNRLISMGQELALCKAHLEVMGYRHGVIFELHDEGVDKGKMIPPAVIHTLVENAVTHNAYPPGEITFMLKEFFEANRRHLVLETPFLGESKDRQSSGSGLRYVEARLQEIAPHEWKLSSGAENGMWVTHIELPATGLM